MGVRNEKNVRGHGISGVLVLLEIRREVVMLSERAPSEHTTHLQCASCALSQWSRAWPVGA